MRRQSGRDCAGLGQFVGHVALRRRRLAFQRAAVPIGGERAAGDRLLMKRRRLILYDCRFLQGERSTLVSWWGKRRLVLHDGRFPRRQTAA